MILLLLLLCRLNPSKTSISPRSSRRTYTNSKTSLMIYPQLIWGALGLNHYRFELVILSIWIIIIFNGLYIYIFISSSYHQLTPLWIPSAVEEHISCLTHYVSSVCISYTGIIVLNPTVVDGWVGIGSVVAITQPPIVVTHGKEIIEVVCVIV